MFQRSRIVENIYLSLLDLSHVQPHSQDECLIVEGEGEGAAANFVTPGCWWSFIIKELYWDSEAAAQMVEVRVGWENWKEGRQTKIP